MDGTGSSLMLLSASLRELVVVFEQLHCPQHSTSGLDKAVIHALG